MESLLTIVSNTYYHALWSASGLSPSSSTGDMISQADIDKAMAHWNEGPDPAPKPRLRSHPM